MCTTTIDKQFKLRTLVVYRRLNYGILILSSMVVNCCMKRCSLIFLICQCGFCVGCISSSTASSPMCSGNPFSSLSSSSVCILLALAFGLLEDSPECFLGHFLEHFPGHFLERFPGQLPHEFRDVGSLSDNVLARCIRSIGRWPMNGLAH